MANTQNNRGATHVPAQFQPNPDNPARVRPKKRKLGGRLTAYENYLDDDERTQQELKRRRKDAKERKGARQTFMYKNSPDTQNHGLAGQVAHLSGLTAEGLAGEAFADILVFALQFIFNTGYLEQCAMYQRAKDEQVHIIAKEKEKLEAGLQYYEKDQNGKWPNIYSLDRNGNPQTREEHLIAPQCASDTELRQNGYFKRGMRMIYEADENGNYPVTYMMNPNTGELDHHNEIKDRPATPMEQIANGFVPEPSVLQGYSNVFYRHMERMTGFGSLSPEAKMWLYGSMGQDNAKSQTKESDPASDRVGMGIKPPTPKIGA